MILKTLRRGIIALTLGLLIAAGITLLIDITRIPIILLADNIKVAAAMSHSYYHVTLVGLIAWVTVGAFVIAPAIFVELTFGNGPQTDHEESAWQMNRTPP